MQLISSIFIGLGLGIIGMSLLNDPWAIERFERTIRETARLENSLLPNLDAFFQTRNIVAYLLIACSFITMNRIGIMYVFTIPILLAYGFFNYNQILYQSDRFGGANTISGALFFVALSASIIDARLKFKEKTNNIPHKQAKID